MRSASVGCRSKAALLRTRLFYLPMRKKPAKWLTLGAKFVRKLLTRAKGTTYYLAMMSYGGHTFTVWPSVGGGMLHFPHHLPPNVRGRGRLFNTYFSGENATLALATCGSSSCWAWALTIFKMPPDLDFRAYLAFFLPVGEKTTAGLGYFIREQCVQIPH